MGLGRLGLGRLGLGPRLGLGLGLARLVLPRILSLRILVRSLAAP